MQQPGDRIDIRAGEHDTFDRRGSQVASWVKDRACFDLLAKVGRGVDQKPTFAVAADGK
jgi:hypothetical protein